MAVYRTAQGKMLDMGTMMTQNEKVRAVGNGKMNARGDTIDPYGRVVVPVSQKVSEAYAKTVNNLGAQVQPTQKPKSSPPPQQPTEVTELTDFEKQLNEEMASDQEVEELKKTETVKKGRK